MASVFAMGATGCSLRNGSSAVSRCAEVNDRLGVAWERLRGFVATDAESCLQTASSGAGPCDQIVQEIRRMGMSCPNHVAVLLANAIVLYDQRERASAQQYLDRLLTIQPAQPEAAMLRARIALDEGNLPYVKRLLTEQLRVSPDHAGLRETYAAALYLSGDLDDARSNLEYARQFGAPSWRVAYHLGLVEEAAGNTVVAASYYREAIAARPGWLLPVSRLNGLNVLRP